MIKLIDNIYIGNIGQNMQYLRISCIWISREKHESLPHNCNGKYSQCTLNKHEYGQEL